MKKRELLELGFLVENIENTTGKTAGTKEKIEGNRAGYSNLEQRPLMSLLLHNLSIVYPGECEVPVDKVWRNCGGTVDKLRLQTSCSVVNSKEIVRVK